MSFEKVSFETVPSKKGPPGLVCVRPDGTRLVLHSLVDPVREGKRFGENLSAEEGTIFLVLGVGLGYHVRELAEKFPRHTVIAVSPFDELVAIRREVLGENPFPSNVLLIESSDARTVVDRVLYYRVREGLPKVTVLSHAPLVSLTPEFFRVIERGVRERASLNLKEKLRYRKFRGETLTVLVLDYPYFLIEEIKRNLIRLGHRVVSVSCSKRSKVGEIISRVTRAIVEQKPDFLLTVNHLGFDEDGHLTSFLESIEFPVVVWYVDSPEIILAPYRENVSDFAFLFLWDNFYVESMVKLGFRNVDYLPLATDETVFTPSGMQGRKGPFIGFVGSSISHSLEKAIKKSGNVSVKAIEECAQILYGKFLKENKFHFDELLLYFPELMRKIYVALSDKQKSSFRAAVIWKASQNYRVDVLSKLLEFSPVIHGDSGWNSLLNKKCKIFPPLKYYTELPDFYRSCYVNLNITNFQVPTGVNQRVFDVPAAGGFLLTDYRASLEEILKPGKEVVVYKDPEEVKDLVSYFQKNPEKREEILLKAMEKIRNFHTYKHRLTEMILRVRNVFGVNIREFFIGK